MEPIHDYNNELEFIIIKQNLQLIWSIQATGFNPIGNQDSSMAYKQE